MKIIKQLQKGFTLIEVLLVIVLIGILISIGLVTFNAEARFIDTRNDIRKTHIQTLEGSITQYRLQEGNYPTGLSRNYQEICDPEATVCTGFFDLKQFLVPTYLQAIPQDPNDADTTGGTGYSVAVDEATNTVSVRVIQAEGGETIAINDPLPAEPTTVSNTPLAATMPVVPIVTNGLVLHLDAGNTASYPGTGNTWIDLSGVIGDVNINNRNSDWIFTNDPSTGLPSLFNNNNRTFGNSPGINIPMNNGFNKLEGTIQMWLKPTGDHVGGHGWFNNSDGTTSTNASNWFWIGTWNNSSILYFRQVNSSTCCNDTTVVSFDTNHYPLNSWNMWTVTWNVSAGRATIYKNSTILSQRTNLPTNIPNTSPSNTGQLFNGHTRTDNMQFKGYCNTYNIYNRELSLQEVQQNFNTTRGRFGL